MITPDLSRAAWRKSSRSGTNADCVEIAVVPGVEWRKSSRSGSNADCVEIAVVPGVEWRKSSRSGSNAACVEVAVLPRVVAVRDSKHPDGPALAFTAADWSDFLANLKTGAFDHS